MASMSTRPWLPLWTLVPVASSPLSWAGSVPRTLTCLLLKDGTLVLGVTVDGPATLAHDAGLAKAVLRALPDGGFVQAITQTKSQGDSSDTAQEPTRLSLLTKKAGGTTYWFGRKRHLQPNDGPVPPKERRALCAQFLEAITPALRLFCSALGSISFVEAEQITRLCHLVLRGPHAATWPNASRKTVADALPWGQAYLEQRLGQGEWMAEPRHLLWRGASHREPLLVQASSVSALVAPQEATMRESGLSLPQDVAAGWSVCHEKSDQARQVEQLRQRHRWLHNLLDNPSFRREETRSAHDQADALLRAVENEGATLFRTTMTCVTYAATPSRLEQQSRMAAAALEHCDARLLIEEGQQGATLRSALPGCGYQSPTGLALLDADSARWWPAMRTRTERTDWHHTRPRSAS